MKTIFETWHPETGRHTEVTLDSETGLPLIVHVQNVRPIIENNKRLAASFDRTAPNPHGMTRIASIPTVVWGQLVRDGIAYDQERLKAWLDERDHRLFRTDDGRRV
jgi:hypothetical protein